MVGHLILRKGKEMTKTCYNNLTLVNSIPIQIQCIMRKKKWYRKEEQSSRKKVGQLFAIRNNHDDTFWASLCCGLLNRCGLIIIRRQNVIWFLVKISVSIRFHANNFRLFLSSMKACKNYKLVDIL
jgi:hypothetical protein